MTLPSLHTYVCNGFTDIDYNVIIAGGIHGVGHVMKEHRRKDLFRVVCSESSSKMLGRQEVIIGERKLLSHPFQKLGTSNYIVLNKLSDKQKLNIYSS